MLLYLFEEHDPHIIICYYHTQPGRYLLGVEQREKHSQADDLLRKIYTLYSCSIHRPMTFFEQKT